MGLVLMLAVVGVTVFDRKHLFDLPREQPWLWAAVLIRYPLLSVYPQELLFRAFLLHRYAPIVGGGRLFARRYQRSRSLLTVSVEHALYGITIFTFGLGRLFSHGADG